MNLIRSFKCRLMLSLLITCTCAGMMDIASATKIYKWVDENGVTHYANKKPSGVKWKLMPETRLSVIPGNRIGAEAARAAKSEQAANQNPIAVIGVPQVDQRALAERRARMLQDCRVNNGIDCEREVDTELRAEGLQQGAPMIHLAPPPVVNTPVPTPVPAREPPASALR